MRSPTTRSSGFGLILPLGRLDVPHLDAAPRPSAAVDDNVIVIAHGGIEHCLAAKVIARREFAGYWEYLLEDAIYTSPPHPQWGGAALLAQAGRLIGVGSLLVQEAVAGDAFDAQHVRADRPPRADPRGHAQARTPCRPAAPLARHVHYVHAGQLVVGGFTQGGPAHRAGVRVGDVVLEVAGEPVTDLGELFRKVWSVGPAGSDIPITLARGRSTSQVQVRSADRNDYLAKPRKH